MINAKKLKFGCKLNCLWSIYSEWYAFEAVTWQCVQWLSIKKIKLGTNSKKCFTLQKLLEDLKSIYCWQKESKALRGWVEKLNSKSDSYIVFVRRLNFHCVIQSKCLVELECKKRICDFLLVAVEKMTMSRLIRGYNVKSKSSFLTI